ncbi:MAG: effector-associated domain EAD1-containing protein [Spirulina sp.]
MAVETPEKERAEQTVERFIRRFQDNYRIFLYHVALPLILTPELVNYLRHQFTPKVPWVAEADLLLSDLCRPVGYELYAMDASVRAFLLDRMEQELGMGRMQAVARGAIAYTRHLDRTNPYLTPQEKQAQQWAAMAYLEPGKVARELAEGFQGCTANLGENVGDRAEMMRLARITQELAPQLREHEELLKYASVVSDLLTNSGGVEQPDVLPSYQINEDIELSLPEDLLANFRGGTVWRTAIWGETRYGDPIPKEQDLSEQRILLWQQNGTQIYSCQTELPWLLPFDALIIPVGPHARLGGRFAQAFQEFLGDNQTLFRESVYAELQAQKQVDPDSPLVVSLPLEIRRQLGQTNEKTYRKYVICATVEKSDSSIMLTSFQRQQLRELIMQLYPTRSPFSVLLLEELGIDADAIAPNEDYTKFVFELIGWLETRGKLGELIETLKLAHLDNLKVWGILREIISIKEVACSVEAILNLSRKRGIQKIVTPLLGTGVLNLPVEAVAREMLMTVDKILKTFPVGTIREITFADRKKNAINILNNLADTLFRKSNESFLIPIEINLLKCRIDINH